MTSAAARGAQAKIDLPGSHLDFGFIASGSSNALRYLLTQPLDGAYRYTGKLPHSVEIIGSCGYVTNHEFNKPVVIAIKSDKQLSCKRRESNER